MKSCFSCKRPVDISGRPGRGDVCAFCGADLKVCLNCVFYDKGSANDCREPSAESVKDKDRANFCEYFQFRECVVTENRKEDPMEKLRSLFKR